MLSCYLIVIMDPSTVFLNDEEIDSLCFKHPANILISGPSGSGKTQFTKKLIEFKDDLFHPVPEQIVWCFLYGMAICLHTFERKSR